MGEVHRWRSNKPARTAQRPGRATSPAGATPDRGPCSLTPSRRHRTSRHVPPHRQRRKADLPSAPDPEFRRLSGQNTEAPAAAPNGGYLRRHTKIELLSVTDDRRDPPSLGQRRFPGPLRHRHPPTPGPGQLRV
jgi:hypothetical protein